MLFLPFSQYTLYNSLVKSLITKSVVVKKGITEKMRDDLALTCFKWIELLIRQMYKKMIKGSCCIKRQE